MTGEFSENLPPFDALPDFHTGDIESSEVSESTKTDFKPWQSRAKAIGFNALGFGLGYGAVEVFDRVTDFDPALIEKLAAGTVGSMATSLVAVSMITRSLRSQQQ